MTTACLTVVALDHITLRWETPIDPKLALAVGVVANHGAEQAAPEVGLAMLDLVLFGRGMCKNSFIDGRIETKHVPYSDWRLQ